MTDHDVSSEFMLDRSDVRRSFARAANSYDDSAVLQARVRTELLARLELVRLEPAVVLDLGAGTGHATAELRRRYRGSTVVAIDLAEDMLKQAAHRQSLLRRFATVCADAQRLPLRDASADLVFSNLMLQWCNEPDAVFRECRRVLRPRGLLTFTTFGPDTLMELRRAWAAADRRTHVNRFMDMHDLGDAIVRAGLAEPVLDVDRCTLTYAEVPALMKDLKAIGAHNVNAGRAPGLTGKSTLARMIAAYEEFRREGRLPATYEIVYGHAWAPEPRMRAGEPGETRIPISSIGKRGATGTR